MAKKNCGKHRANRADRFPKQLCGRVFSITFGQHPRDFRRKPGLERWKEFL